MRFLHFLSANLHFTIFLTKFAKRNIFTLSHNFICVFKISTMDLINRLKHYMDIHQITISQFADRCGIPRPTMSQLINGRNKRISDEVINKVHSAFPDLSILWLMFGEGDMESNPKSIAQPQEKISRKTIYYLILRKRRLQQHHFHNRFNSNHPSSLRPRPYQMT